MIYSTEGRSPDTGREPVGNEGGTDTDYIWVLGFRLETRLGGRIADPNMTPTPGPSLMSDARVDHRESPQLPNSGTDCHTSLPSLPTIRTPVRFAKPKSGQDLTCWFNG